MKEIIEKSGLTNSQFAKKYEIPYNTVRQWAEEKRKAPDWIKKLFKREQEYKPLLLIEEKDENTSLITEEGIRRTISLFEYVIYYKAQNGAFIKVPVDMLVEQFKGITKNIGENK